MDLTPLKRREHADITMAQTIGDITNHENRNLKKKMIVAAILYLCTLAAYTIVFLAKEDKEDQTRGLAYLNPLFILASDVVILSLRE